jgi:serine/threonine protein kinase
LPASPYMPPEQVRVDAVDGRSDLFSVGCMLFEMVAGCRPFDSANLMAAFYRITHDEPQWQLCPSEPHWDRLRGVVKRALDKTVTARYPDAAAMREELHKAIRELAEHVG